MAIKISDLQNLVTVLKDKQTTAVKQKDGTVLVTASVEQKITKENFESIKDEIAKAEIIVAEKTFVENEEKKFYPDGDIREEVIK